METSLSCIASFLDRFVDSDHTRYFGGRSSSQYLGPAASARPIISPLADGGTAERSAAGSNTSVKKPSRPAGVIKTSAFASQSPVFLKE